MQSKLLKLKSKKINAYASKKILYNNLKTIIIIKIIYIIINKSII